MSGPKETNRLPVHTGLLLCLFFFSLACLPRLGAAAYFYGEIGSACNATDVIETKDECSEAVIALQLKTATTIWASGDSWAGWSAAIPAGCSVESDQYETWNENNNSTGVRDNQKPICSSTPTAPPTPAPTPTPACWTHGNCSFTHYESVVDKYFEKLCAFCRCRCRGCCMKNLMQVCLHRNLLQGSESCPAGSTDGITQNTDTNNWLAGQNNDFSGQGGTPSVVATIPVYNDSDAFDKFCPAAAAEEYTGLPTWSNIINITNGTGPAPLEHMGLWGDMKNKPYCTAILVRVEEETAAAYSEIGMITTMNISNTSTKVELYNSFKCGKRTKINICEKYPSSYKNGTASCVSRKSCEEWSDFQITKAFKLPNYPLNTDASEFSSTWKSDNLATIKNKTDVQASVMAHCASQCSRW